jgi:hypothetical protein
VFQSMSTKQPYTFARLPQMHVGQSLTPIELNAGKGVVLSVVRTSGSRDCWVMDDARQKEIPDGGRREAWIF